MRSRADAAPAYLYVPELLSPGQAIRLPPEESQDLSRVCRARAGDTATATDGRGRISVLRVVGLGERVTVEVESEARHERSRRVWAWCGAPEGERVDWLIEKLAELGVEAWQPLECRRGTWGRGASRRERWDRLAIAGMRQSRRAHLMDVRAPISLAEALESMPEEAQRWLAQPGGAAGASVAAGRLQVGAVGPSGGFTDDERNRLEERGFSPISLSDGRLRTETATLAWAVRVLL